MRRFIVVALVASWGGLNVMATAQQRLVNEVKKEISGLTLTVDNYKNSLKKIAKTLEDEETAAKMQKMLDMFEDNDDIQNVWHNWEA